jgi:hypothetical protein
LALASWEWWEPGGNGKRNITLEFHAEMKKISFKKFEAYHLN